MKSRKTMSNRGLVASSTQKRESTAPPKTKREAKSQIDKLVKRNRTVLERLAKH